MSAASAGVSELMDAEKKASTVVAEARAARSDRLKAAKAEAGAAVDDLRAAREDDGATLDEVRESVEILESVASLWTRIFGEAHPETPSVKHALATAREQLARALAPAAGSAEEKS